MHSRLAPQGLCSPFLGIERGYIPGACSLWIGDKAQSNEDLVFCFSFREVSKWPQLRSCSSATGSGVPEDISP